MYSSILLQNVVVYKYCGEKTRNIDPHAEFHRLIVICKHNVRQMKNDVKGIEGRDESGSSVIKVTSSTFPFDRKG